MIVRQRQRIGTKARGMGTQARGMGTCSGVQFEIPRFADGVWLKNGSFKGCEI
jgi:hypothetical protein